VRLAVRASEVADKLLLLRELLPQANVSALVAARPALLLAPAAQLRAGCQRALALLGSPEAASRVLQQAPELLDPPALERVLGEVRRLFGAAQDPAVLLARDPSLALSCQGLRGQSRGERDEQYLAR
jgi:hypothetical protein